MAISDLSHCLPLHDNVPEIPTFGLVFLVVVFTFRIFFALICSLLRTQFGLIVSSPMDSSYSGMPRTRTAFSITSRSITTVPYESSGIPRPANPH